MAAALARLPDDEQLVITLSDLEDLSPDEVCTILDISAASQRELLHRARAFVRRCLEGHLAVTGTEDGTASS